MSSLARWLLRLFAVPALALLAACQSYVAISDQEDFQSFEHPFTDEAEARVRKVAERGCEHRKLVATRVSRNCTLKTCYTTYKCVDKDTATGYRTPPPAQAR